MLKLYKSPEGYTFQFEEGTAPAGYELVGQKAAPKARKTANKAKAPANKKAK